MRVGTSGWQYADWRGPFYPDDLPQRRWLEHYAATFGTVEVNGAFYRLPSREVFQRWAAETPPGFVAAVKVSRYLTHVRRLRDPAEPVARFLASARGLGDRLGPVLLQLPPTMSVEPSLLDATLRAFGTAVRVVVEPRHDSWFVDDVFAVLAGHGAALCWGDRRGRRTGPLWITADFGYLRLHEGTAAPAPGYGRQALASWHARMAESFADSYVYFNNDHGAAAVRNALLFRDLGQSGVKSAAGAPRRVLDRRAGG